MELTQIAGATVMILGYMGLWIDIMTIGLISTMSSMSYLRLWSGLNDGSDGDGVVEGEFDQWG